MYIEHVVYYVQTKIKRGVVFVSFYLGDAGLKWPTELYSIFESVHTNIQYLPPPSPGLFLALITADTHTAPDTNYCGFFLERLALPFSL
jgi:hypothetical protein